jgi:hypothetical protein
MVLASDYDAVEKERDLERESRQGIQRVMNKTVGEIATLRLCAERAEALLREAREFVFHEPYCPLAQWSGGRPTEGGGYETMYAGKWYRGEDKPTCTCGLNALLVRIKEAT